MKLACLGQDNTFPEEEALELVLVLVLALVSVSEWALASASVSASVSVLALVYQCSHTGKYLRRRCRDPDLHKRLASHRMQGS